MIAGSILIGRVLGPIDQLIGAWKQWSSARQSLQRLEVMLAANPPQAASLPLPAPNGTLTVNQLAASAPGGSAPVLHGVSFRLEAGEVLGVIGASGSGKTLLMRQLVGALTPLSGDVRLDGADLRQWDKQQLGPHIGYLPQDIQLFAGTLTENIARFGQVDAEKVVAAAALAGVHQPILHLPKGYETELGEGGSGLSGGQRQRAGARAVWLSGVGGIGRTERQPRSRRGRGAAAGDRSAEKARHHHRVGDPQTGDPATTDRLLVLAAGQVQHFGPSDAILKNCLVLRPRPYRPTPAAAAAAVSTSTTPILPKRPAVNESMSNQSVIPGDIDALSRQFDEGRHLRLGGWLVLLGFGGFLLWGCWRRWIRACRSPAAWWWPATARRYSTRAAAWCRKFRCMRATGSAPGRCCC